MKFKSWKIALIVVFLFLILVNVLYSSYNPVPYYPENIFAKQFPYTEGMKESAGEEDSSVAAADAAPEPAKKQSGSPKSKPVTSNGTPVKTDEYNKSILNGGDSSAESYEGAQESGVADNAKDAPTTRSGSTTGKKENFANYLSAGSANQEQTYMYLGDVNSDANCANSSLGLSNSMGYLCLSDEQIQFLRSRGGNSVGRTDF
jgi:hypothetical protein